MKAYFTKVQGELKWFGLAEYLKNCKDGHYRIDIVKQHNNRSLSQNSYYWGIVLKMLSDELWYEIDDVHEVMLEKFATKKVRLKKDKRVKLIKTIRSKEMTTIEFEDYLENIRVFASKYLNLIIPLPNDNYECTI